MSNVPDTLANRIKLFRKLRGMTQQDLSEAAGVNLSIIKKYEVGILNPKIERLEVIANALGISLYSLVNLNVNTVNDILSIILQMDENTMMNLTGKKRDDGKYIPESIHISFNDEAINAALAEYLEIRDSEKANNGKLTIDYEASLEQVDLLIEDSKAKLYLNNDKVKRPE